MTNTTNHDESSATRFPVGWPSTRLPEVLLFVAIALADANGIASYRGVIDRAAELERLGDEKGHAKIRHGLRALEAGGFISRQNDEESSQWQRVSVDFLKAGGAEWSARAHSLLSLYQPGKPGGLALGAIETACGVDVRTVQYWISRPEEHPIPSYHAAALIGLLERTRPPEGIGLRFRNNQQRLVYWAFRAKIEESAGAKRDDAFIDRAVVRVIMRLMWQHTLDRCRRRGLSREEAVTVVTRLHSDKPEVTTELMGPAFDYLLEHYGRGRSDEWLVGTKVRVSRIGNSVCLKGKPHPTFRKQANSPDTPKANEMAWKSALEEARKP